MAHRSLSKERFWRNLHAQFDAQNQSAREFCRCRRLAESAFYFWRRELAQRDAETATTRPEPTPRFEAVAVVAAPAPKPPATPIDLRLADGAVLRVRPGFDAATLRQLLGLLAPDWLAPTVTSPKLPEHGEPPC